MTEPCSDLVPFADGELDEPRADAFRAHLATCATCQTGLVDAMQLHARLSTLSPRVPLRVVAPPVPVVVVAPSAPGVAAAAGHEAPGETSSVSTARGEFSKLKIPPRKVTPARSTWKAWSAAAALITAGLAVWLVLPHDPVPPTVSARPSNPFAALKTRPYAIRFAYPDAAGYREVTTRTRGVDGPPPEHLPSSALGELQRRNDVHGLAIAEIWNDGKPAEIAKRLRALQPTPATQNDLAAIESLHVDEDHLEPVLRALEAVQHGSDPAAARAATWNYAVQLEKLALLRGAAGVFTELADGQEPGWSTEARKRASTAASTADHVAQAWKQAVQAGEALWKDGTPVPADTLRTAPGLMRARLYDAVRTAPTRDRVLALAGMALALDGAGPPILGSYVQRVAKLDFARRAALARSYGKVLSGTALTPEETRALTTSTPSADVADIVLGGMTELGVVPSHLDAFGALARSTGDPWFAVLLARAAATADQLRGDWLGAETRLRKAQTLCTPEVAYPCLDLAGQLARIYRELHRVPLAIGVVRAALRDARRTGAWEHHRSLLLELSEIERFNSSTAMARAYANEVLLLSAERDCRQRSTALLVIAGAALLDANGRAARTAFEAALAMPCRTPDLAAASCLAEIGRLDPQSDDRARLHGWIGALRDAPTWTPAQSIVADATEGRLWIERDSRQGTELLEKAIRDADLLEAGKARPIDEITVAKARAGAYSTLVIDAARRADHARVITLVAQELGLPAPTTCAVAVTAEDERAAVAVRGADGTDHGLYDPRRSPNADLRITEDLAGPLAGCAHVQVMARASLQGQPHVLPATLAWSYATGAHRRAARPAATPPERRLIVMNVVPPAELALPTLLAEPLDTSPAVRALSGLQATPTRVLAELPEATEIQLHTHALVDVGVSSASHLVLSPEPDGRYALTAESIRGSTLRGHPVVMLAACHSAQGARYPHAAWSLPDAFLTAGARGVFAVGPEVPDREAGPFFELVLASVRRGADPATALRDERVHALAANPSSWIGDVMLFE